MTPGCKVYIFIDGTLEPQPLNEQIFLATEAHQNRLEIHTFRSQRNLGVAQALPAAVDWVLEYEDSVIILEDDCIPNRFALSYFEDTQKFLDGRVLIVSARSPWAADNHNPEILTLSSYPLSNGWLINSTGWIKFREFQTSANYLIAYLFGVITNLSKTIPLSYFFAASLLARNGLVKSWDSELAFFMLVYKKFAITPDQTCVEILGVDAVASNTLGLDTNTSEVFLKSSNIAPTRKYDLSKKQTKKIDKQIEKSIYFIKLRNIFSPVKSWLRIIKNFFVNFV
jgi:hypothetical protein